MDLLGTSAGASSSGPAARRIVAVAAIVIALLVGAQVLLEPPESRLLTEVYTPTFAHVPPPEPTAVTLDRLASALRQPEGHRLLESIVPGESGVLWIAWIVVLVVAFDFTRPFGARNADLVAMQLLGLCFFQILRFLRLLRDPTYLHLLDWIFTAIVVVNLYLLARAWWRARRPLAATWRPTLGAAPLAAVALVLVVSNVTTALVKEPDDAGFFMNLATQRLRERHLLPYGDPLLDGSAAAAYGPLNMAAHLPFQLLLAPHAVNPESPDRPPLGRNATYFLPPPLATKLCAIAFHLLAVFALYRIARRLADERAGWALVALYCGSAYVMGVGGDSYAIGGMTYVSHIAPPAVTLAAFALLTRPAWAGTMLAVAAGIGLYPAFLAPAWLGYYWDRGAARWKFLAGLAVSGLSVGLFTLFLSRPSAGRGRIGTILADILGHHTDPHGYGSSPFSFWGQRPGVRAWMLQPLVGNAAIMAPLFLAFAALAIAAFWMARRRTAAQLALVTAGVVIAAGLTKIHPTGTYVAWFYPFLLIGHLLGASGRQPSTDPLAAGCSPTPSPPAGGR